MNIDVTALELLPEFQTADGLKPKPPKCESKFTKVNCYPPTCANTDVRNRPPKG